MVLAPASAPTRVLKAAIALGLVADAVLVALLIAVAGYVFGGPERPDGAFPLVLGLGGAFAVSVLSPLAALPLWRRGRRDVALAMVWLPIAALLVGIGIGLL